MPAVHRLKVERTTSGDDQPLIDFAIDEYANEENAMPLRQRARLALGLPGGFRDHVHLEPGHGAYVYAIGGEVTVDGTMLSEGDAAMITEAFDFDIDGSASAHAIVAIIPTSAGVSVAPADAATIVGNAR